MAVAPPVNISQYNQQVGYAPVKYSSGAHSGADSNAAMAASNRRIYSPETMQGNVNTMRAQTLQGAQTQANAMKSNLAGRGFGSNSPLAQALGAGINAQARAGAAGAEQQARMGMEEANANYGLDWYKTAQQSRAQDLGRLELAAKLAGLEQSGYLGAEGINSQERMQDKDLAAKLAMQKSQFEQEFNMSPQGRAAANRPKDARQVYTPFGFQWVGNAPLTSSGFA